MVDQALRLQIDELKAKITVQRLAHQEEVNRLIFEHDQAIRRAEEAEQRLSFFEEQNIPAKKLRGSYKTLSELTDQQYRNNQIKKIQNQLGPAYKIVKIDDSDDFLNLDFLAFQRVFRLPTRTVNALSKIPKSQWPTARQLEYAEKKLIEECGGFVQEEFNAVKIISAADPRNVFIRYVKNLRNSVWNGSIPNPLTVVLSGDKGSETTKFGLFVPTGVPNAQSPYNFLLLSMYQGPETHALIKKANAVFFEFTNSIVENGGLEMDVGNGPEFIAIKVLFVSDLKMLPLVFGVDHSRLRQHFARFA